MPTETQDEPLHPALAEHDAAREEFLNEASEIFEARRTPLNPISDKLSEASRTVPPAKQDTPSATSPRSPAAPPAETPASNADAPVPGKIPGISELLKPGAEAAANASSASDSSQPASDLDAGVLTPEEYQKGKTSRQHFDKLYSSKEGWKRLAKERELQLEQLKKNGNQPNSSTQVDPKIVEQLKLLSAERDSLQARLEAVAVEKSPRFEAAFKPRIEAAISQAKAAVGPERAAKIESLLQQPESAYRDEQIESMLAEMGTSLRAGKLQTAVADLDRINAERAAMASRGSELFRQWQSEESASAQRQRQEREQQAIHAFEQEAQGWKDYVKNEDLELARDVYIGKADLTAAARASLWAVAGPKLARQSMDKDKRIAELESELAKFRSVQPGRDTAGGNAPSASDDLPQETSYADAIARRVQEAGLLRR